MATEEKKKTGYQSTWQDQLRDTANKIINREKFSYDINGDALYKQYKDRYTQMGKQAMMDTMGQAQAMTGGYGNSYAQTVGQQTYQGYMQQLTDKVPTLYQIALDKYTREGDQMRDNMNLMMQQDDIEYGRYRDQLSDQDAAYNKLMALMTGYGYKPTAEEMEAAGMTEAQYNAIMGLNKKSSSGGGRSQAYVAPTEEPPQTGEDVVPTLSEFGTEFEKKLSEAKGNTSAGAQQWNAMSKNRMEQAYKSGQLTDDDVIIIAKKYGIT